MIEAREPKYQWGQPVVAAIDLYNDGSLPDAPQEDILLVVAGGPPTQMLTRKGTPRRSAAA